MPYHLQRDLCTNEQSTWWNDCLRLIEFKSQQSFPSDSKIVQKLNHGIDIIRLKRVQSKQLNIQICIKTAFYLQNWIDEDSQRRGVESSLIFAKSDINEMLPIEEKLKYLNVYAAQYWSYIANYLRITYNLEDEVNTSLNESLKVLNFDSTKRRINLFFDVSNDFVDLFKKDQLNVNIYQFACLYVANKKFNERDFSLAYDLLKDLKFDRLKFNDEIEHKLGKNAKKIMSKIGLSPSVSNQEEFLLINLVKEKLKQADEYVKNYEASLAPKVVEIAIKSPVKQQYLSPIKKTLTPPKHVDYSPVVIVSIDNVNSDTTEQQMNDQSIYKSVLSNTNNTSDNLSMKTANETLDTTNGNDNELGEEEEEEEEETTTSFEISKEEEEDVLVDKQQPQEEKKEEEEQSYAKQIMEKLSETRSIKINLYHDILKNQFNTINQQRNQFRNEISELQALISKIKSSYQNQ